MAEEESGFTFVDKRRTTLQTEAEPASPVTEEPPIPSEAAQFSDTEEFNEESNEPPTTYDLLGYCINLLASQAWQKLGLLADPQTGEAKPDLVEAKIAIDSVGDLAARLDTAPETAVPADLRRDLRTLVNDLRLNYVSQRGPVA